MTNYEYLQRAARRMSELIRIEGQYSAAKVLLADGDEMDIPADKITALKQRFATIRSDMIDDLNSVTA